MLKGKRKFRNYPSSLGAYDAVSSAINARVQKSKTIVLGAWDDVKDEFDSYYTDSFIFPMGGVPKPHQPEVVGGARARPPGRRAHPMFLLLPAIDRLCRPLPPVQQPPLPATRQP